MVEDLIEEMFRSAETGREITKRAVVVDAEPTKANKTTPGSGRRSLLKKDLTGPTLLEMSGKGVNQELDRKWGTDTLGVGLVVGKAKPIRSELVEFVAGRNNVQ